MSLRRAALFPIALLAATTILGCDVGSDNSPEPGSREARGAKVGESIELEGRGRKLRVTVAGVLDPAPVNPDDKPEAGARFVAIDLRLENTGDRTYDDAPFDGAMLLTADSGLGESTLVSDDRCDFGPQVMIRPGQQVQGCMLFEVPRDSELVTFEFTLSPGSAGGRPGQWRLGADT